MAWTKKPGSPDYVNALARLRIGVGATGDDWLIPWLNLLPAGEVLDVNAFCEAGPPPPASFAPEDFLALLGGPLGIAVQTMLLRDKISARAREVLFASLCQQDTTGTTQCTIVDENVTQEAPAGTCFVGGGKALLPGTTEIRVTYLQAGTGGVPDMHCHFFNPGYLSEAFDSDGNFGAVGQERQYAVPGAATHVQLVTNNQNGHYRVQMCHPGGVEEYEPEPVAQPDTAIPPEPGVYTTIADLGAELDEIEKKLHWVLDFSSGAILSERAVLVADELVPVVDEVTDIPLGPDVAGFIVTCSSIPNSVDMRFGNPPALRGMGRVVVGNGTAWQPPIEITVSPMLILKTSSFQTAVRVQVTPPATATVQTLVKSNLGLA